MTLLMNPEQLFHTPLQIFDLLSKYEGQWMIAGGWAIDLFLNRMTREHQDIEIAIPRKEQGLLKKYLKDWRLQYVIAGAFHDWENDDYLNLPIHEIHGQDKEGTTLEILLNEIDDGQWRFRRDLEIRYPSSKAIIQSPSGMPILAPEVVLLYKAKWHEAKDQADFEHTINALSDASKMWLRKSIIQHHGTHGWLMQL